LAAVLLIAAVAVIKDEISEMPLDLERCCINADLKQVSYFHFERALYWNNLVKIYLGFWLLIYKMNYS
jgi:hypothetical protein